MRKLTMLLGAFACSLILVPEESVQAVKGMTADVVHMENNARIALKQGETATIDTDKASNLGFGRLYPFSEVAGTGELYYFTTSAMKSYYQVKALVTAGTGLHIEIYDATGTTIVAETDLKDGDYERFTLDASKKFYLRISGDGNAAGEIIVSEIADDYADTPEEATAAVCGQEYIVTTECLGDVDYLKFTTGTKDVTYSLTMESVAGIAGAYELQNEAGERLEEYSGLSDIEKKITQNFVLEQGKTYYIKFSSEASYCRLLVKINETVNKYKITYHLSGGTNNKANPATYTAEQTIALKPPTRKGYTFEGWFADAKYTKAIYNIAGFGKRNYDLYAKWSKTQPGETAITSLASTSAGKVKLSYKSVSGAAGYQILYTRIVEGKRCRKYKTNKGTTMNFTGLKQGEKYYFAIRAYAIDSCGNRIYGAYSKVKTVMVKKKVTSKKKK